MSSCEAFEAENHEYFHTSNLHGNINLIIEDNDEEFILTDESRLIIDKVADEKDQLKDAEKGSRSFKRKI